MNNVFSFLKKKQYTSKKNQSVNIGPIMKNIYCDEQAASVCSDRHSDNIDYQQDQTKFSPASFTKMLSSVVAAKQKYIYFQSKNRAASRSRNLLQNSHAEGDQTDVSFTREISEALPRTAMLMNKVCFNTSTKNQNARTALKRHQRLQELLTRAVDDANSNVRIHLSLDQNHRDQQQDSLPAAIDETVSRSLPSVLRNTQQLNKATPLINRSPARVRALSAIGIAEDHPTTTTMKSHPRNSFSSWRETPCSPVSPTASSYNFADELVKIGAANNIYIMYGSRDNSVISSEKEPENWDSYQTAFKQRRYPTSLLSSLSHKRAVSVPRSSFNNFISPDNEIKNPSGSFLKPRAGDNGEHRTEVKRGAALNENKKRNSVFPDVSLSAVGKSLNVVYHHDNYTQIDLGSHQHRRRVSHQFALHNNTAFRLPNDTSNRKSDKRLKRTASDYKILHEMTQREQQEQRAARQQINYPSERLLHVCGCAQPKLAQKNSLIWSHREMSATFGVADRALSQLFNVCFGFHNMIRDQEKNMKSYRSGSVSLFADGNNSQKWEQTNEGHYFYFYQQQRQQNGNGKEAAIPSSQENAFRVLSLEKCITVMMQFLALSRHEGIPTSGTDSKFRNDDASARLFQEGQCKALNSLGVLYMELYEAHYQQIGATSNGPKFLTDSKRYMSLYTDNLDNANNRLDNDDILSFSQNCYYRYDTSNQSVQRSASAPYSYPPREDAFVTLRAPCPTSSNFCRPTVGDFLLHLLSKALQYHRSHAEIANATSVNPATGGGNIIGSFIAYTNIGLTYRALAICTEEFSLASDDAPSSLHSSPQLTSLNKVIDSVRQRTRGSEKNHQLLTAAVEAFTAALQYAVRSGGNVAEAIALGNLGATAVLQDDLPAARMCLERHLQILKHLSHSHTQNNDSNNDIHRRNSTTIAVCEAYEALGKLSFLEGKRNTSDSPQLNQNKADMAPNKKDTQPATLQCLHSALAIAMETDDQAKASRLRCQIGIMTAL